MHKIEWVENKMPRTADSYLSVMALPAVQKAQNFHRSFPMYAPTPLADLKGLARAWGLGGVFVKDESHRFGLNAFKVLGGSFAMARYVAERLERDVSEIDYAYLTSDRLKREFGQATFFTATDGNHGRGVAWAANRLGQKAVVFMPRGSQQVRLQNILREGAWATIEDANYDACVRIAAAEAARTENGVLMQDTALDGYEKIPSWIMQGYGTMAAEAAAQLGRRPTHIFVQAGVGSMAGAVQGYFANLYPDDCPVITVVEPSEAACHYRSALRADGGMETVDGEMPTIMAGLACGEPSPLSFDLLKNHARFFAACPDWVSARGMRMLGAPVPGDPRVISGESGAVCLGMLAAVMQDDAYAGFRAALGLDESSVVLLFSTEGDTDPDNYRHICWEGAYSSEEQIC